MFIRTLSVTAAVAVSATLLAACSGGSSLSPAVTPNSSGTLGTQAILGRPASTLSVMPTTMTLTNKMQTVAQLSPNTDFYSQKNSCVHKHIVKSIKYFDYGMYYIIAGRTNGTCSVTFTDTITKATAKMTVVNEAN
jgi:hypothetical protein